jgi:hypothetical protein
MSSGADRILDKIAGRTFGLGDGPIAERRQHARFPFQVTQRVAPYVNGEIPPAAAFRPVECYDISCSGFSYYLTKPPMVKEIVLALVIRAEVKYLKAVIVHTNAVCGADGLMYLVGCRFMGRIDAA